MQSGSSASAPISRNATDNRAVNERHNPLCGATVVAVNPWEPHNFLPKDLADGALFLVLYLFNASTFLIDKNGFLVRPAAIKLIKPAVLEAVTREQADVLVQRFKREFVEGRLELAQRELVGAVAERGSGANVLGDPRIALILVEAESTCVVYGMPRAVAEAGLADAAASQLQRGADLQIMFGIGGERDLSERELPHLAGWRDSHPVRVGNGAWTQRQLDVYGELLGARLTEIGQKPNAPFLVAVGGHGLIERRALVLPVGDQLVERDRIDHRARQDVRADGRGLLDHADAELGLELLEPDREGEAGGAGADRDHVVFHDIAFAHRQLLPDRRRIPTRRDQLSRFAPGAAIAQTCRPCSKSFP